MNYLYLIRSGHRVKIGITAVLKRRVLEIDKTTKGKQRLVFAVLVWNARGVEAMLHRRYKHHHAPLRVGSGRSEWFKGGFWIIECALLMLLISALHWLLMLAAFTGILLVIL